MGRTFYVNGEKGGPGNDGSKGESEALPWKSIEKVNKGPSGGYKGGDTILFKGGISPEYTSTSEGQVLKPSGAGEAGSPITYGSYGSGKAELLGKAKTEALVVLGASKGYLVFENLKLNATAVNDIEPKYAGEVSAFRSWASGEGVRNVTIRACEALWVVWFAFAANSGDVEWTIEDCLVEHTAYDCISCGVATNAVFPTNWVIEHNTFKSFAEYNEINKKGEETTTQKHGIYGRLANAKVKYNTFEASPTTKGACISQRGPDWEVVANKLLAGAEGTCFGYFPYTNKGGSGKEKDGFGTSLFAYNILSTSHGETIWYCTSDPGGTGDIGESFTVINNTFSCPGVTEPITADFRNAHGKREFEGKLVEGSTEVTLLGEAETLPGTVGWKISGPGIRPGTTIEKVKSSTVLVLSATAEHSEASSKLTIEQEDKNSSHLHEMSFIFKNNIVSGSSAMKYGYRMITQFEEESKSETQLEHYEEGYNDYYGETANPKFYVYTTEYTSFEKFQKGKTLGHDKNENPKLISGTLALERSSPCVAKGTSSVTLTKFLIKSYTKGEADQPFEYTGEDPDMGARQYLLYPVFIGEPVANVSVAKKWIGIPLPTQAETGDLLVMMVVYQVKKEGSKIVVPSGWTEHGKPIEEEISRATFTKEYKGESSLYTIEGEEGYYAVYVAAIRGWNLTAPINEASNWQLLPKKTGFKVPTITSKEAHCLAIGLISSAGGLIKGPAGWTEQKGGIGGSIGTAIFSKKLKESESTGEEEFTQPEETTPAAMTLAVGPM